MGRPTNKPRVPLLDPEQTTIDFVRSVLLQWRAAAYSLEPLTKVAIDGGLSDTQIKRTRLYRELVQVAQATVRGEAISAALFSQLITGLEPLLQSPLLPKRSLQDVLATIDPDDETDPIKLLLSAALTRQQLAEGTIAISSSQLAILAGVTRRHVGAEIREGQLEADIAGRRGTAGAALIRRDEALRWLRERGTLGPHF